MDANNSEASMGNHSQLSNDLQSGGNQAGLGAPLSWGGPGQPYETPRVIPLEYLSNLDPILVGFDAAVSDLNYEQSTPQFPHKRECH